MAVLALFTGKGLTKDMYDLLRKEVGFERNPPRGAIFHAASFDEKGDAHVADVWESKELLDQFVNSRLMPAMKKLNAPAPEVVVYPAHNINAFAPVDTFKVK